MRTYDQNFKIEAVELAEKLGVTKASKELGIPNGTLATWQKNKKDGTFKGIKTPKMPLTLEQENRRLKQENKELRETNEILSKATAFFAKSQKK